MDLNSFMIKSVDFNQFESLLMLNNSSQLRDDVSFRWNDFREFLSPIFGDFLLASWKWFSQSFWIFNLWEGGRK